MDLCEICQKKRCQCDSIISEETDNFKLSISSRKRKTKVNPTLSLFENTKETEMAFIKRLLAAAKARAEKKGIEFSLTENDVTIPRYCPVLGIPIYSSKLNSDNSPSIDRFNNKLGYIPSNITIISTRANRIKNDSNFEEIEKLYLFLKEETLKRRP
jgi:hypothetical protein